MDEVAKHTTEDDCWVVIHGKVYNMTPFLDEHPGGVDVILEHAGKDATAPFEAIHSKGIIAILPKNCYLGDVDRSTVKSSQIAKVATRDVASMVPPIDQMLNVYDFQHYASKVMTKDGWDYYASGADDEVTLRENQMAFSRIWFRPRVLVDVSKIDTKCKILGKFQVPPLQKYKNVQYNIYKMQKYAVTFIVTAPELLFFFFSFYLVFFIANPKSYNEHKNKTQNCTNNETLNHLKCE